MINHEKNLIHAQAIFLTVSDFSDIPIFRILRIFPHTHLNPGLVRLHLQVKSCAMNLLAIFLNFTRGQLDGGIISMKPGLICVIGSIFHPCSNW
jgi:hypothetical protein